MNLIFTYSKILYSHFVESLISEALIFRYRINMLIYLIIYDLTMYFNSFILD